MRKCAGRYFLFGVFLSAKVLYFSPILCNLLTKVVLLFLRQAGEANIRMKETRQRRREREFLLLNLTIINECRTRKADSFAPASATSYKSLFLVANKKEYINRGYRKARPYARKTFCNKKFLFTPQNSHKPGTLLLFGLTKAAIKYKLHF